LELGADDYITKPFSIREFTARVRALNRRIHADREERAGDTANRPVEFPSLRIDPAKRAVTVDGTPVTLTAKEFDLLYHFANHPGQAFSRIQLLETVWGYQYEGYEHTVNSHINRLRAKVERDPSKPRYIRTVWGVGYRFADVEELEE
jgi:DNA-binding response OmpR family regulator